jgi:hypothetical protein
MYSRSIDAHGDIVTETISESNSQESRYSVDVIFHPCSQSNSPDAIVPPMYEAMCADARADKP